MIILLKDLPYEERLVRLRLSSLVYKKGEGWHHQHLQLKYVHGIYKVSAIERSDFTKTRGHQLKLKKTWTHHRLCQAFFSTWIVDLWNSLPEQVVMAPAMNSFKSRLDNHWSHVPFLYNYRDYQGFLTGRMRTTNQTANSLMRSPWAVVPEVLKRICMYVQCMYFIHLLVKTQKSQEATAAICGWLFGPAISGCKISGCGLMRAMTLWA